MIGNPGQDGRPAGHSFTSVACAILVNAPTLKGWYLLQGQAVPISRTTGMYALLFSSLNRCKGERGEIRRRARGVFPYSMTKGVRRRRQMTACYVSWPSPSIEKHGRVWNDVAIRN